MKAGLNLYSIRTEIQDEKSFLVTAKKLKEYGYSYMQYSGAEFDAERIARVSEESGLPVCLTHVSFDRIVNDTEKLMEEHARFGCKNIGLGGLDLEPLLNLSEGKKTIDLLNGAAEKMAKNGFKFFYHHHHFEFVKDENGETLFDYIIENAKFINITLDTYWMQYAGKDLLQTIRRLKGRIGCVHLKDYQICIRKGENGEISFDPKFAPVGYGNMDFSSIVQEMQKSGVEYYLVEQDDAVEYENPMYEVLKSIKYINKRL